MASTQTLNFDKVWVGGEWLKASNVVNLKLGLQALVMATTTQAKQGTWDVKAQYFNQKKMLQSYSIPLGTTNRC